MIDWYNIFTTGVWLAGSAIVLCAVSFGDYEARASHLPFWRVLPSILAGLWAQAGVLVFSIGMVLSRATLLEKAMWGLLGLSTLYGGWSAWRSRRTSPRDTNGYAGKPNKAQEHDPLPVLLVEAGAELLIRVELVFVALLLPFFLFLSSQTIFMLSGLPVLWIIRRVARGHFIRRTPLDWAILVMLVMVLVSLFVTFDMSLGLEKISALIYGVGLYYALVEWASNGDRLRWSVAAYAEAGAALALLGLAGTNWLYKFPGMNQIYGHLPSALRELSSAGSGFHPNIIAGALLWFVLPLAALTVWAWSSTSGSTTGRGWRFGLTGALVLTGGTLVLTQSRGALLGAGFGGALLAWLVIPRLRLSLVLLTTLAIGAILLVSPTKIADKLLDMGAPDFTRAASTANLDIRQAIWSRAIYGIQDFPLTGMGVNAFRKVLPAIYPVQSPQSPSEVPQIDHAHNQFFQAALDMGLPGLTGYIALWVLASVLVVGAWRRAADAWSRALLAGIMAALLASFLHGVTDAVVLVSRPGILFWAMLGLLVAQWRQVNANSALARERLDDFVVVSRGNPRGYPDRAENLIEVAAISG